MLTSANYSIYDIILFDDVIFPMNVKKICKILCNHDAYMIFHVYVEFQNCICTTNETMRNIWIFP